MNITTIRPRHDNVLIRMSIHERREEERTPGGIVLPRARNELEANESLEATVIAVGPGHYHDRWIDHETGTTLDGTRLFVPVDPRIVAGATVIALSKLDGDALYSDDRVEYRMVRADTLVAAMGPDGELLPLGDRVVVQRDTSQRATASGVLIPDSAVERRTEGTVVAVGHGKVVEDGTLRDVGLRDGDRVIITQYGGTEFGDFVLLREEDVLAVVETGMAAE